MQRLKLPRKLNPRVKEAFNRYFNNLVSFQSVDEAEKERLKERLLILATAPIWDTDRAKSGRATVAILIAMDWAYEKGMNAGWRQRAAEDAKNGYYG